MRTSARRTVLPTLAALGVMSIAPLALAQLDAPHAATAADPVKDAEDHFRRGVSLYKEGDFAAAVVEFKRAYELAPNYRVLYDVGQTDYQLQRYAPALLALRAYLEQGGAQVPLARRAAVEQDIRGLEAHVATVDVRVGVDGARVLVDDDPVGTSPLSGPLVVSVGRRKISVVVKEAPPQERFIEVASGDHGSVTFEVATAAPPVPAVLEPAPLGQPSSPASPPPGPTAPAPSRETVRHTPRESHADRDAILWGIAAAMGVATIVTGAETLALRTALTNDLNVFPGNASTIEQDRTRAKGFGVACDVLSVTTAIGGGVALYFTLSGHGASDTASGVAAAIGPAGAFLRVRY